MLCSFFCLLEKRSRLLAFLLLVEAGGLLRREAGVVDLVLEAVAVVHVLEDVERLCASLHAPEALASAAAGAAWCLLVRPSPLLSLLVVVRAGDAAALERRGRREIVGSPVGEPAIKPQRRESGEIHGEKRLEKA